MKTVTETAKNTIYGYRKQGLRRATVARMMKLSYVTVNKYWNWEPKAAAPKAEAAKVETTPRSSLTVTFTSTGSEQDLRDMLGIVTSLAWQKRVSFEVRQ